MPMMPETPTSAVAQAPPDRQTLTVEQWARQGMALLLADRVLDMNERKIVFNLFQTLSQVAANGGVLGAGPVSPEDAGMEPLAESPNDMNQNTEDYGSGMEGVEPMNGYDDEEGQTQMAGGY